MGLNLNHAVISHQSLRESERAQLARHFFWWLDGTFLHDYILQHSQADELDLGCCAFLKVCWKLLC